MLSNFGLTNLKPAKTPGLSEQQIKEEYQMCLNEEDGKENELTVKATTNAHRTGLKVEEFSSAIGALQYLANIARPEIAHAVNTLASFTQNPQPRHLIGLLQVFRYLSGTKALGIKYSLGENNLDLPIIPSITAFSDADWAGDLKDRKSTSGRIVKLFNGPISWSSKKQTVVALSSHQSEYIAVSELTKEVIWSRRLMETLGYKQTVPTIIRIDNNAALATANGKNSDKTKHIDIRYHYIQEQVREGNVTLLHIPTISNQADILTKSLANIPFNRLLPRLMGQEINKD